MNGPPSLRWLLDPRLELVHPSWWNFCLILLAQEHCPQAQMTVLSYRDMAKMSTARLLGWPSNMVTHKSCIYPSTWLCRRGTGKVFPWRKAARAWTSTSQSVALWPWAGHLPTQSLSFPIWKMKSPDLLLELWGLQEIMHVKQPAQRLMHSITMS